MCVITMVPSLQKPGEHSQNDVVDAIASLKEDLNNNCKNKKLATYTLAVCYEGNHNSQEALDSYKKTRKIDPSMPFVNLSIGRIYLEQGQYERSIKALNREVALMPKAYATYKLLGKNYEKLGNFKEAIQSYKNVLKILVSKRSNCANQTSGCYSSTEVEFYLAIIRLYRQIGDNDSASEFLRSGIERNPGSEKLKQLL